MVVVAWMCCGWCWWTTCCCCICPLLFPFIAGEAVLLLLPLTRFVPFVPAIVTCTVVVVVPLRLADEEVLFVFGDCWGTDAGCGLTDAAGA